MARHKREEIESYSAAKVRAFQQIARTLGKDHPITKMMGSLAWGRSHAERGPDSTAQDVAVEFGYLQGYFDALNFWARDHDAKAQRVMRRLWPSGYRTKPL